MRRANRLHTACVQIGFFKFFELTWSMIRTVTDELDISGDAGGYSNKLVNDQSLYCTIFPNIKDFNLQVC
jgi:hypothetical protein